MKRGILFILSIVLFVAGFAQAQVQKPKARWTYSFSKPEVKKGETVDLVFTATIDKDWYMYSSDFDPDLGPMLTTFTFEKNNTFEVVGKLKPQSPKTKFEEVWGGNVRYFEGKGVFKQTVKILADNPVIKGASEFQTCSHVTGLCIAGSEDFEFKGLKVASAGGSQPNVGAATPASTQPGAASATETAKSAASTAPGVATPAAASAANNDTAISIAASDNPDYVFVDWGPDFLLKHGVSFPESMPAFQTNLGPLALAHVLAAGGAGYFRMSAVQPYLTSGQLQLVPRAPQFSYPVYAVYSSEADDKILGPALAGLHSICGKPLRR